jgi:ribonuclease P protein component
MGLSIGNAVLDAVVKNVELVSAGAPRRSLEQPVAKAAAGFSRLARLLKHSDFERVYKQGRRQFSSHITVFYLRRVETDAGVGAPVVTAHRTIRVGFTVGRVLGGAVDRNRIKRRLREAVQSKRALLQGLDALDVVINPKKTVLKLEFAVLLEDLGRAFNAISKKLRADRPGELKK